MLLIDLSFAVAILVPLAVAALSGLTLIFLALDRR
jgi:hypothetical protein